MINKVRNELVRLYSLLKYRIDNIETDTQKNKTIILLVALLFIVFNYYKWFNIYIPLVNDEFNFRPLFYIKVILFIFSSYLIFFPFKSIYIKAKGGATIFDASINTFISISRYIIYLYFALFCLYILNMYMFFYNLLISTSAIVLAFFMNIFF